MARACRASWLTLNSSARSGDSSGRVALPSRFADELMQAFAGTSPRQKMWVEEPPEIPRQKVARRSKVLRDH